MLKKGQIITWPGAGKTYRVLRVTANSTTVQPVEKETKIIKGKKIRCKGKTKIISTHTEATVLNA